MRLEAAGIVVLLAGCGGTAEVGAPVKAAPPEVAKVAPAPTPAAEPEPDVPFAPGDPWGRGVLAALSLFKIGRITPTANPPGEFRYTVTVCADGKIEAVHPIQSTGEPPLDNMLIAALQAVRVPRPPDDLAPQFAGRCRKLGYVFWWRMDMQLERPG